VIVGTGNHFFFDAVGGALAIGVGFVVASWIETPATRVRRSQPVRESAAAMC
jgi:hypothetical protein